VDREAAWHLLCEWTQGDGLRKHALAVEAAMRAYARRFGEDEDRWGITGLLHDFDYERHPSLEEHPFKGRGVLAGLGYPADVIHAIQAHAERTGVPRASRMDKALYAVDELCGFITAAALIRPSKSVLDLEASSVRKRMKDKAFARNVKREDIERGAEELGIPLDEHIAFVIEAMRGGADALGLRGTLPAAGEHAGPGAPAA
jgi:putative nucleotidyltransferase with HDIG domain